MNYDAFHVVVFQHFGAICSLKTTEFLLFSLVFEVVEIYKRFSKIISSVRILNQLLKRSALEIRFKGFDNNFVFQDCIANTYFYIYD